MTSIIGPKMNIIVAVCENMGIGKNNTLPWHLPNEFKYFTEKTKKTLDPTKKNAVLLGRKCWESVPPKMRPLKNRINIILSKTMSDCPNDAYLCRSVEEVWELLSKPPLNDVVETVWNLGGKDIYELGLQSPFFHRLYITKIYENFDCDVFFPEINFKNLRQIQLSDVPEEIQQEGDVRYRFEVYEKCNEEENILTSTHLIIPP